MAGFKDLRGKVVVITGASSGIGRACAHAFARRGCRLVLAARNGAALAETSRECRDLGGEAVPIPTDVGDWNAVARLADMALTRFGAVDVWINNAGVTQFGRFEEVPLAEFEQVIRTNLMGTVHGSRAAIPVFREQGRGVLINISSVAGTVGQPETSAYVASKWAIRGLSESLRMELMDAPAIAVCTVLAPSIDTPLFQHGANHSGREVRPMPPVYPPEQVAQVVIDLAYRPRREAFIGKLAPLLTASHAIAPALTERMMARTVERKHFTDTTAADSAGNVFAPKSDTLHGGWAQPERRGGNTALALAGAAALALPLGVYAWRRARENRQRSSYV